MAKIFPEELQPIADELKAGYTRTGNQDVKVYKGFRFARFMEPESIKYAMEEWKIPEKSVFVVTHPKSGTNWSREIVNQILYQKDKETLELVYSSLPHPLFFLEACSKRKFQLLDYLKLPRVQMITHISEELFDFEKVKQRKGKVIYIMRNPKDRLVSYFHFRKKMPPNKELDALFGVEWNDFFNSYMMGKHLSVTREGESYPEHILGWLKHKDDKDFLLVAYEDMKKDLPKEVARFAEFLEIQLTNEEVTSIADACTFTKMKKRIENEGGRDLEKAVGIMRKGEVGGWKELFTVAQSEQMDKQIEEKLGNTGIKFTYEL